MYYLKYLFDKGFSPQKLLYFNINENKKKFIIIFTGNSFSLKEVV